jgi:autotransporter-associated beta strand protein
MNRRTLLKAAAAAGVVTAVTPPRAASAGATLAFVADYQSNIAANLTVETNAAVRILAGMQRLWHTGTAWNTGSVLDAAVLRANMRHTIRVTRHRTPEQAARAFIADRQHQSYAVTAGLGPLADAYRAGALAVTSITSAPAGTPATTIADAVPVDAPACSAIGAGSPDSALGAVVTLVNTLRGPYASGNPSKAAYRYPRPWRMTVDNEVLPTGAVDELGYPVYASEVVVAPQLLRQRGLVPADDGGFPSGHTNAFHLAALAFAYAIPERFQELVTAALDLADTRIVSGMHSPVDVIGGRILATALAAATLADPANAELKARARLAAAEFLRSRTSHTTTDAYGDRAVNKRIVEATLTYALPRGRARTPVAVPAGAEVLLDTRQPYLSAAQRREVLRTTALGAGHPLLDGPEHWGRLNLFAAADGYGAFDRDTVVTLHAAAGGLGAADTWRNDIAGWGGLVKAGTGTLTLTGANTYRGGTTLRAGTLVAAARTALGTGDVLFAGGTLRAAAALRVGGDYRQRAGTLATAFPVTVGGEAVLGRDSVLRIESAHGPVRVLSARRVTGRFARVVAPAGFRAEVAYGRSTVTVRLHRA